MDGHEREKDFWVYLEHMIVMSFLCSITCTTSSVGPSCCMLLKTTMGRLSVRYDNGGASAMILCSTLDLVLFSTRVYSLIPGYVLAKM